jgi:hypothetical protein
MRNLVIIALVVAVGYALVNEVSLGSAAVRIDGSHVLVDTGELEVRFYRAGPISDSFMVFGGTAERHENSFTDATMATLAMRHAQLIHQRYPDFHRCKSPGAAQAQRLTETSNFVGANPAVRRALVKAVGLHDERVGQGGERTCVSVNGEQLTFDSVRAKRDGSDLTQQLAGAFAGGSFYLAESVEIPECQTLLR